MASQFVLLKDRRFLPLFITQFLGAFHDNLFKNAFVALLLFDTAAGAGKDAPLLTTLAAGVFILPFVLFSATGGQLTDRFAKERVIRAVKIAEIGIAGLGTLSLLSGSTPLCFLTLFALGTHSAFFGPGKYGILPQHLQPAELIAGNALLNTGTFLAILAGTIAGTVLINLADGRVMVSTLLFAVALAGYAASRRIPPAPPTQAPEGRLKLRPAGETLDILRFAFSRPRETVLAVFGIGWFYFMGGMFTAQLPVFVKTTLAADERTLALLLTLFSVGIAAGGLLNNRLLRGKIAATFVPWAMLGITLFALDLAWAGTQAAGGALPPRVLLDVIVIALCGGLFVVPLNALVQDRAPAAFRARMMAGCGIVNALFIVASSALSAVLIGMGVPTPGLFAGFALANAAMALFIYRQVKAGRL